MNWLQRLWARLFDQKQTTLPILFPRVYILQELVEATTTLLISFRDDTTQHEGIVYWAGVSTEATLVVTTVIAPYAYTTHASFHTSTVANAQVIAAMASRQLQVLAQVHGHPGAWVGHSDGDNKGAFMPYTGFYSIVAPNYGLEGLLPLSRCGVHCFVDGRFIQLSATDIDRAFSVIPTSIDLRKV